MTLQKEDIDKIKKEMAIGNLISIVLIFGILIFDLVQILQKSFSNTYLILINISGFFLAILINYLLILKYRKDLDVNEKYFVTGSVSQKIIETEYEAGSGVLYIPILGDLFPKMWGQEMKKEQIKFIKVNEEIYYVEYTIYESLEVNDIVKIYYSKISKTFLNIEKQ